MLDRTKHMENDTDKSPGLHRGHVNEYLMPSVSSDFAEEYFEKAECCEVQGFAPHPQWSNS